MRLTTIRSKDGRRCLNWPVVLAFVAAVHLAVIGGFEAFWYALTGGFSPLMGGFGLVTAWIVLVRVIGEALCGQESPYSPSPLKES
jgi:hypothetical protein